MADASQRDAGGSVASADLVQEVFTKVADVLVKRSAGYEEQIEEEGEDVVVAYQNAEPILGGKPPQNTKQDSDTAHNHNAEAVDPTTQHLLTHQHTNTVHDNHNYVGASDSGRDSIYSEQDCNHDLITSLQHRIRVQDAIINDFIVEDKRLKLISDMPGEAITLLQNRLARYEAKMTSEEVSVLSSESYDLSQEPSKVIGQHIKIAPAHTKQENSNNFSDDSDLEESIQPASANASDGETKDKQYTLAI